MGESLNAAQRGKIRRLAGPPADASEEAGEINVVPFLDIITNVLMFVLATIAITFTSTVEVSPRAGRRTGISPPKLELTVLVGSDGFGLKARGGNVATGCADAGPGLAIPKRDGGYDYAALQACAAKLKASSGDFAFEQGVTVSASPQIPYQTLIATVDAVRRAPDGSELFPDVAFAVVR